MDDLAVAFDSDRERYELRQGEQVVGFATARRRDGVVTLPHVEVAPAYRGRDLATRLVRAMLDDIHARGERIVPLCPFVRAFLRRYPSYQALAVRN